MTHPAENGATAWDEALDEVESRIRAGASPSAALWAAREDNPYRVTPPAWCLCGFVDDLGDGTCGNCGLRIMTEDDEARVFPPAKPDADRPDRNEEQ